MNCRDSYPGSIRIHWIARLPRARAGCRSALSGRARTGPTGRAGAESLIVKQARQAALALGRDHPVYRTFATLDRRSFTRFLELGTAVAVDAGRAVMAAGIAVDGFYLVINGRLVVEREGHRLRELEARDFVRDLS